MIRVVLADDQSLVRAGFRALLCAAADVEVVGEAEDGDTAVRRVRDSTPDLVLMDIRMPGRDGLEATREIVADPALAGVKVIILTTFAEDDYIFEALRCGASGFLVKDTEPADLVNAVRTVHAGDALLSPAVTPPPHRGIRPSRGPCPRRPRHAPPPRRAPTASAKSSPSPPAASRTTRSPASSSSAPPPPRPTSAGR